MNFLWYGVWQSVEEWRSIGLRNSVHVPGKMIEATLQSEYENACLHKSATTMTWFSKGGYEKVIKVIYAYICKSIRDYTRTAKECKNCQETFWFWMKGKLDSTIHWERYHLHKKFPELISLEK